MVAWAKRPIAEGIARPGGGSVPPSRRTRLGSSLTRSHIPGACIANRAGRAAGGGAPRKAGYHPPRGRFIGVRAASPRGGRHSFASPLPLSLPSR